MKSLSKAFATLIKQNLPEDAAQQEITWARYLFFAGAVELFTALMDAYEQSNEHMNSQIEFFKLEIIEEGKKFKEQNAF